MSARRQSWRRLPFRRACYFAALSLVILGPLLVPHGYVLTLDTVWGPHFPVIPPGEDPILASLPVRLLLAGFQALVGGPLAQTGFLFGFLTLAGIGMYRLVPGENAWAKYAAGTFYAANPFVYQRLVAGHWGLLLGYALLPFALRALRNQLAAPSLRGALWLAAWWLACTMASAHFLFIFGLVFTVALVIGLLARPAKRRWLGYGLLTLGAYLLANLYWLWPLLGRSSMLSYFDHSHLAVFATAANVAGSPWFSVLTLEGFYRTGGAGESYWAAPVPWLMLGVLALAGVGLVTVIRRARERDFAITLLSSAYLAIPLAVGVADPATRRFYELLYDHLPGFHAMRESQKFALLLVVVLALYGGVGFGRLRDKLAAGWPRRIVTLGMIGLIAAGAGPLWWGAQLHRVSYPGAWETAGRLIAAEPGGQVLALPWQQYVHLSFTNPDRVVANPAPVVFPRPVYISSRADVPGLTESPPRPLDQLADRLDHGSSIGDDDYRLLQTNHIRWIAVLNVRFRPDTRTLESDPRLRLVSSDPEVLLFRVADPT